MRGKRNTDIGGNGRRKMSRTAFIFPGQGAQYTGMAKDFYDCFPVCRKVFQEASEAAGFSMEKICFEENEKIHETKYTQPALLTASCAILEAVKEAGICADFTAGLSLGEYCALTAAQALPLKDAAQIVCRRGIYMEEEVAPGKGAMAAVIGKKPVPVEKICEKTEGIVGVANYNYPGQKVISGETRAVEEAGKAMLAAGASRVVPLQVSGPFHSPLLAGAGKKLRKLLESYEVRVPRITFVSNVTAEPVKNVEKLKELLGRQVCSPVRWQQSMEYMIQNGVDMFIEIGPGHTLSNFAKKIDRSLRIYNVETVEDLENLKREVSL